MNLVVKVMTSPKKESKTKSSSSAAALASKSAPGEWRSGSSKEKGKKRTVDDFVKILNNPKRIESRRKNLRLLQKSKAQKEIMMVDLDGNKSAEVPIGQ